MTETYVEFIKRIEDYLLSSKLNTDREVKSGNLSDALACIPVYQRERVNPDELKTILRYTIPLYQNIETEQSSSAYHTYWERTTVPHLTAKRRLFLHISSYLPPHVRGMTDTLVNIWINYNEYDKDFVLNHELLHVLHPEWSESLVREFHSTYTVDRSRFDLVKN